MVRVRVRVRVISVPITDGLHVWCGNGPLRLGVYLTVAPYDLKLGLFYRLLSEHAAFACE